MSDPKTCQHCGRPTESVDQRLRGLFAARVGMPARLNRRSDAASTNELATAMRAAKDGDIVGPFAEDVIDPRSAYASPRRAVGFIEFKPGEEPERWDADWDGGVK